MTNEYIAKCPYCNFKLIDDGNPSKIIGMVQNHAQNVHGIKIVFKNIDKIN